MNKIILVGPPGSGKGTQASEVTKNLNIPHISTGEIFRSIAKGEFKGNVDQTAIAEQMNKGELISDKTTFEIVKERLALSDCKEGFLLDGFPRNISQAKMLDEIYKIQDVILIDVDEKELIKRLTGRMTCPVCKTIYHKLYNPPLKEGICDKDGTELYVREDDKKETVMNRLKVYKETTEPLIDYYKNKGNLRVVDGNNDVGEVTRQITEVLRG